MECSPEKPSEDFAPITTMDEEFFLDTVKEEVDNKDTLCRLCACCTQLLIPIFEGEGLENSLSEKIEKHLPVQVAPSDVLPLQVCYQCASTVISWHELTTTCVQAEKELKSIFCGKESGNEPQFSQLGSRDDDVEIFDESGHSSRNLDTDDTQQSIFNDKSEDQLEEVTPEEGSNCAIQKQDVRFIADVTEDNNDVVCLKIEEESNSVTAIEFQPSIDHSYTREPQKLSKVDFKSVPHGTRQPFQPILPQPSIVDVTTVFKPQVSSRKKAPTASAAVKTYVGPEKKTSQTFLVCSKVERRKNPAQNPFLLPTSSLPRNVRLGDVTNSSILPKFSEVTVTRVSASAPRKSPVKRNELTFSRKSPGKKNELTVTKVPVGELKKMPLSSSRKMSWNVPKVPVRAFACTICGSQFTQELLRRRHMFHSHGVKQHMCQLCRSTFGTKDELRSHMRNSHQEKPRHKCGICSESFLRVFELRSHIRARHPAPRTVSRTSLDQAIKDRKVIAGMAITDKEAIMLKEFHSCVDNKDVYHCKECKKSWTNFEKTVTHIRTHTKEQLYSCETCGARFNTRGVLQRHMQTHQNSKPFPCQYCDKAFSSKQNRDDHHRSHTKEVKTVCESCGEFLTSASMLYYHRKIHSGINPYKCPYCDKAYSIRALLKRHVRFHTGETPHLCSVCGRGFKTSGQLRGHSAVHSDARPFACDGCGNMLKTRKYLKRHRAICPNLRSKEIGATAVEQLD